MPSFRSTFAAGNLESIPVDIVRELAADVTHPANLFVAPPLQVAWEHQPTEDLAWEIFRGRLLDGTQTRERRRFETWGLYLADVARKCSAEPILAVRFDAERGVVHVTRAILCRAHESYDAGDNVILTREVQKWQRELVGTIILDEYENAGMLRDELACLLFQGVVGLSRLPLTSIESPLPGFALGQIGYFYRPSSRDVGALTTWPALNRLRFDVELAPAERIKHFELLLRATPIDEIRILAKQFSRPTVALLRAVFNSVTLSPYTDFVAKTLAFVRCLIAQGSISEADRADFVGHLVNQLARHLTAYDLVTFHHRGANFPDALLLDELMSELIPLVENSPELFTGQDRGPRLRRRAIRNGLILQLEYTGHPVPSMPTSPGENLRVLPTPFRSISEEEIYSPTARSRRLFVDERVPELAFVRACFADLDRTEELQELGTALFLDRPLGFAKAPGEPDQTLLASHVLFSQSIAKKRLDVIGRRPEWLPDRNALDRCNVQLAGMNVGGIPLRNAGPPSRPGVVSLHDALRVADDWMILRTTRRTLRDLQDQFDLQPLFDRLGEVVPPLNAWRMLVPGGTDKEPTLCVYDDKLKLRLEFAADLSGGYRTRGGVEFPAAGLRVRGTAPPFTLSARTD